MIARSCGFESHSEHNKDNQIKVNYITMKKLYRSEENKVVAGILGGIGEYFEIDPVVIRVFFVFLAFATGVIPFVVAYIVALFVVPKRPHTHMDASHSEPK